MSRNFEEYRAEVLEQLGATAVDLRNESLWRAKVLEALGAEYTDEDTRNFERYRLKVLENLSGGGSGGGGSSDFSTATAVISNRYSVSCEIPTCDENEDYCYAISNLMGDLDSTPFTIPLYKGKALVYFNSENITTTGDIEDDGDGYYFITGDCTITIS